MKSWRKRSLFYLSKMYVDRILYGEDYDVLEKCISINILDFKLFANKERFYFRFYNHDYMDCSMDIDDMEIHIIELPKLPEKLEENSSDLLLWAKFINAEKKEEFEMLSRENASISRAYEKLQVISQDRQKRMEYEAREKAVRDYNQMMKESRESGLELGRAEGIGVGEKRKAFEIAKKLLASGVDEKNIVEWTGLSFAQIEGLKNLSE